MRQIIVAKAVSADFDHKSDDVFVTFKVTDQKFKKIIKQNWSKDVELLLVIKNNDEYEVLG